MVWLVLWLCASADKINCIAQHAVEMPATMTTAAQEVECRRRAHRAEWALTPNQFFSCEEKQTKLVM